MIKHNVQRNIGEKKRFILYVVTCKCLLSNVVSVGTQARQDLEAVANTEAVEECFTGLFVIDCSVCYLLEPRFNKPRLVPPKIVWVLHHQSLIKKMPYMLAYIPIIWRHFFS